MLCKQNLDHVQEGENDPWSLWMKNT